MVTVEANDEFLYLDLAFPTTKLHGRGMGEDGSDDLEGGLNGMEAAFQVSVGVAKSLARCLIDAFSLIDRVCCVKPPVRSFVVCIHLTQTEEKRRRNTIVSRI